MLEWKQGGHFVGTTFTVPFKGKYSFRGVKSSLHLFVNGKEIDFARESKQNESQATGQLDKQLDKNDKVTLKLSGIFEKLDCRIDVYAIRSKE